MPTAADNGLNILYEDNHLIVVIKPEGLLSQPDITGKADVLSIVRQYIKNKYNKPKNVYLGLVHRLDQRVGGLMVLAKTSKAAARISKMIRERSFRKYYLALVLGNPPDSGELKDYLYKAKQKGGFIAKEPEIGMAKTAVLQYEKLNSFTIGDETASFLNINLITGRYNQIRKQLSIGGYPIINDFKYGYRRQKYGDNIGLFCYRLLFAHPTSGNTLDFTYYPTGWLWEKLMKI